MHLESSAISSKMRIVFLTSHAIQYQVPAFARFSLESSWRTSVVFLSSKGLDTYFDEEFCREIKWPLLTQDGYESFVARGRTALTRAISCLRSVSRPRPVLLIIFGWMKLEYIVSILAARILRIDTIVISDANVHNIRAYSVFVYAKRLMLRFPKFFGVIGSNNRAYYKAYGVPDKKLLPWPYAVNNAFFSRQYELYGKDRDKLRHALGISTKTQVLLYSGKLTVNKNILSLLRVFTDGELMDAHLLIVGDGPLAPEISRAIESNGKHNVTWTGFKNQDEIGQYYSISDAVALLSEKENWGLVINEAMLFGLPALVGQQVGCAVDLIIEGSTGILHKVGSPLESSVRAILDLAKSADRDHIRTHISHYNYDRWVETVAQITLSPGLKSKD